MRTLLPRFIAFVACAAAIAAHATDGVTLVNQSSVMAAGGFPYRISQPGTYRLSGNLLVPAPLGFSFGSDGIDISADDVTLDLNGFSIATCADAACSALLDCSNQSGVCSSIFTAGIRNSGNVHTTIRNGSIRGFAYGINLQSVGSPAVIDGVQISNNSSGVVAVSAIVRHCTVNNNVFPIQLQTGLLQENVIAQNQAAVSVGNAPFFAGGLVATGNALYGSSPNNSCNGQTLYGSNAAGDASIPGNAAQGCVSQKNNACGPNGC